MFRGRLFAFSLIEVMVALLVVAIIVAALAPVITKRMQRDIVGRSRISTSCSSLFPEGYCGMCYLNPKSCIVCTKVCSSDEFQNVSECSCVKCSIHHNDSNCTRCNSKYCTQCKQGYYLDSNNRCTICPKGYYCYQDNSGGVNGDGGTSIKKPCPKGYAAPNEGMSACVACAKSTSGVQGSVAVNEGSVNCTLCTNGYYAGIQGQSVGCNKCPGGYYCPSGKLIPCSKGYYCPQGSSSQKACPSGKYSSSANASSCSTCPSGTYSNAGASSCISCPKGSYSSNSGSSSCTKCAKGYYASNTGSTSCIKCAAGYYSNTGASSCTKCASGYYSNSGASSCSKCSDKFEHCVECSNSKCTKCEDGYEPSEDGQKCEKKGCPDKTVEISAGGKKLCVTQYNMGDDASFPLSGVTTVSTNTYCMGSSACCWKGTTSSICNSDNGGYNGCNRTVCTRYAAEIVCANLKYDNRTWRLPTADELASFASYSINQSSSGLMLCDNYSGYGSARCDFRRGACSGANSDFCFPRHVWSGTLRGSSNAYYYYLTKGSWCRGSGYRSGARTVRCVTELDE